MVSIHNTIHSDSRIRKIPRQHAARSAHTILHPWGAVGIRRNKAHMHCLDSPWLGRFRMSISLGDHLMVWQQGDSLAKAFAGRLELCHSARKTWFVLHFWYDYREDYRTHYPRFRVRGRVLNPVPKKGKMGHLAPQTVALGQGAGPRCSTS